MGLETLLLLLVWRLLLLLLVGRVLWAFWITGRPKTRPAPRRALRTLIVLGSGGHTAEMLNFVSALSPRRYAPRCYVAAMSDNMSLGRAQYVEETAAEIASLSEKAGSAYEQELHYLQIYRSREVGQSYFKSIWTTLLAMAHGCWLVLSIRPDVVLCNGPGTCLPICVAAFLYKVVGFKRVVIVYIESIARVRRLSLTGLLLYRLRIVDQFFVQWPKLQEKFPRTQYLGRLM